MTETLNVKELYSHGMYELINSNYDKSIEILTKALEMDPERKLTLISRGSAYLRVERLDEAYADFNRAIELDPEYARAYHLRGLVEERREKHESALKDFDRAIELSPEYGAAYQSRATLHTLMGNEDLAVDDIVMVQHISNKNIETCANENNVWRSQQLRVESLMETELTR